MPGGPPVPVLWSGQGEIGARLLWARRGLASPGASPILPLPSGHRHFSDVGTDAWHLQRVVAQGRAMGGAGPSRRPRRAERQPSSRAAHGRLSETPAAARREPGPSASCPDQRLTHTAPTLPGRQAGAVVCGGTDGRGSADSRQDLTRETDRERDIRLLERGFPISAAAGAPPTWTSTAALIPPAPAKRPAGSSLLWRGPLPQRAASGGGAGGSASEPPRAVSPPCGFSWAPTGLAGLVPKLRSDSATPWGPAV